MLPLLVALILAAPPPPPLPDSATGDHHPVRPTVGAWIYGPVKGQPGVWWCHLPADYQPGDLVPCTRWHSPKYPH